MTQAAITRGLFALFFSSFVQLSATEVEGTQATQLTVLADVGEMPDFLKSTFPGQTRLLVENAVVFIDGKVSGTTDKNGSLSASIDPGPHRVEVIWPHVASGVVDIVVNPGDSPTVSVFLSDDEPEMPRSGMLRSPQIVDGKLSLQFTTLDLRFELDSGESVAVHDLQEVNLLTEDGYLIANLTKLFTVTSEGALEGNSIEALKSQFTRVNGKMGLEVVGTDSLGFALQDVMLLQLVDPLTQ